MHQTGTAQRLHWASQRPLRHALRHRRGGRPVRIEDMRGSADRLSARLSPDGMYYWDGERWVSTLSYDGRQRWTGTTWVPVGGPAFPQAPYQAQRVPRQPTSWTRPMQYAIAAWYAISALYT